ncbi:MAG: hypothetical protein V4592_13550 [Bacteroidota bacterium]
MDITLKYKIVEKIIQSEDDKILNKIKSLLGVQDEDFWSVLPEHVKQSINKAKTELDNNEGIPHDQVMSEIDRLLES